MIIVCNKEGQLCNRLFHFAHFLSFAVENNEYLWYPYIKEYSYLFNDIKGAKIPRSKIFIYSNFYIVFILRLLRWFFLKIPNNFIINNNSNKIINLSFYASSRIRILFLSGWLFRDNLSLRKHKHFILDILKFNDDISNEGDLIISRLRTHKDIFLIGIHIRRGDYVNFENGKYFYGAEVYSEKIEQIRKLDLGVKIKKFIIFTNDHTILSDDLLVASDIFQSKSNEGLDLYCLSKCDLIVGPPSTFSGWASFYGSVPIQFIETVDTIINPEKFTIIEN